MSKANELNNLALHILQVSKSLAASRTGRRHFSILLLVRVENLTFENYSLLARIRFKLIFWNFPFLLSDSSIAQTPFIHINIIYTKTTKARRANNLSLLVRSARDTLPALIDRQKRSFISSSITECVAVRSASNHILFIIFLKNESFSEELSCKKTQNYIPSYLQSAFCEPIFSNILTG